MAVERQRLRRPVTPVAAAHIHAEGGTSNAGLACRAAGCHLAGGGGPTFTFSGTVYTDAADRHAEARRDDQGRVRHHDGHGGQ